MPLFAAVLVTALVLAVPATVSLFAGRPRQPRLRTRWLAPLVSVGIGLLALAGCTAVGLEDRQVLTTAVALAAVTGLFSGQLGAWNVRGLVAWSSTVAAGAAYLGYVTTWLLGRDLNTPSLIGGWGMLVLEVFIYLLALGSLWEMIDVLARWNWGRRLAQRLPEENGGPVPFVSLHVPTHNEPPELVIETLQTLLRLDYESYEVLVLDNNTSDRLLWLPVRDFCQAHRKLRFFHLEDWPGYKSGALNYGLTQTDPRAEVIGIVDADYQVDPDFLSLCVPMFSDPDLAFVQTPQDYRGWEDDPYARRLYLSYSYFFDVSQRSRNERNGAIFGGTMGLIRRQALTEVGGWDEWCITEDAELSLRLLKAGWSGTHVPESFGDGLMPLTFEALKKQRFRWCFGGVQIMRMHLGALLPWPRTRRNRLTLAQRWAYFVGGLQWFGDAAAMLFTGFLLLGAATLASGDAIVVRQFSGPLAASVVGLGFLSWLRSVALLHRVEDASWHDAFGALTIWLGLGWVVAQASVRGSVAREGAFLRTPKQRGRVSWRDSVRGNRVELLLCLLTLAGAGAALSAATEQSGGAALVAGLLLIQAVGFASAPWNSLAAVRADRVPAPGKHRYRRRRRDALRFWGRSRRAVLEQVPVALPGPAPAAPVPVASSSS